MTSLKSMTLVAITRRLFLKPFVTAVALLVVLGSVIGVTAAYCLGVWDPRVEYDAVIDSKANPGAGFWVHFYLPEVDGYTGYLHKMKFAEWAPLKVGDTIRISITTSGKYPKRVDP
jgi:hypothetical protein